MDNLIRRDQEYRSHCEASRLKMTIRQYEILIDELYQSWSCDSDVAFRMNELINFRAAHNGDADR